MTKQGSLLKYFSSIPSKEPSTSKDYLPDPSGCLSEVMPSPSIMACNAEVTKLLDAKCSGTRKPYLKLTPDQQFEIGGKLQKMGLLQQCTTSLKVHPFAAFNTANS